mmetsp:Transcript_3645/g.13899  ORF Transcript_3645/g.13899 Transcript_3645/m.13899 type:complete len:99 (-) Transcript_3645:548-844(-)
MAFPLGGLLAFFCAFHFELNNPHEPFLLFFFIAVERIMWEIYERRNGVKEKKGLVFFWSALVQSFGCVQYDEFLLCGEIEDGENFVLDLFAIVMAASH